MNKVILAGRLTKDPEVKYTQTGKAVTRFNLAVNRPYTKEPTADFIPIVTWNKLAEICGNNLLKGSQVIVEGRMQISSYDGQDGKKRYITEVIADNIEFMGTKPKVNNSGSVPEAAKTFGQEVPPDEEIPF